MNEDLLQTNYDITKKSKLKIFYETNKVLIFLITFVLIVGIGSISFYTEIKERKKIQLADDYIEAKILLENNQRNTAKNILNQIIFENDNFYSVLSLFLILDENLIVDEIELSNLFDQILEHNKFEEEVKNLIIFKKSLFQSNFKNEAELLKTIKPLMNKETLWKPHALLLLGDYFVFNKEYLKAEEFYVQILSLKNLQKEMYEIARSRLVLVAND